MQKTLIKCRFFFFHDKFVRDVKENSDWFPNRSEIVSANYFSRTLLKRKEFLLKKKYIFLYVRIIISVKLHESGLNNANQCKLNWKRSLKQKQIHIG